MIRRLDAVWFSDFERRASDSLAMSSRSLRGVYEMREFFGPGWRMYDARRGDVFIVMLGGGTKGMQTRDIQKAIALAKTIEDSSYDQED